METIAERLKRERIRLGLNQEEMAAAAGQSRSTQIRYEKGERSPDAEYLAAIARLGVDVAQVVTGSSSPTLTPDEVELLRRYRAASPEIRAAALAVLGATVPATAHPPQITGGEHGQVVIGDQTNNGSLTFNVGGQKRGKRK